MARKPKGYKKILDLLACGNELIAGKGKYGRRGYVQATARKHGDMFVLTIGSKTLRSTDETEFMADLVDFADYTQWCALSPEDEPATTKREPEVITLDIEPAITKRRR